MIQHIVMFKFKDTANGKTKAENLTEAKAKMMDMMGKIPEILEMEVHFGAEGSAEANYDYILVSKFNNLDELNSYQKHPLHVAFGQYVKELREPDGRVCIDYDI